MYKRHPNTNRTYLTLNEKFISADDVGDGSLCHLSSYTSQSISLRCEYIAPLCMKGNTNACAKNNKGFAIDAKMMIVNLRYINNFVLCGLNPKIGVRAHRCHNMASNLPSKMQKKHQQIIEITIAIIRE